MQHKRFIFVLTALSIIAGIAALFALNSINVVDAAPSEQSVRQASGRLDLLRVHDRGGFGPNDDRLEGHVVFSFVNDSRAFGFSLGTDNDQNNHKAMFDLLLAAYMNGTVVVTDYEDDGGNNNEAFRIWLGG